MKSMSGILGIAKFGLIAAIVALGLFSTSAVLADDPPQARDEVLVFDSTGGTYGHKAEGLVRQILGLLDDDGKPKKVEGTPDLLPLVSEDGKKKGFDMKGGAGTSLEDALKELKADGGTLLLIAHGSVGSIQVPHGTHAAGFDDGTGADGFVRGCDAPNQLDGAGAKKNVTIKLLACMAGKKGEEPGDTRSVSESLEREITQNGGTVSSTISSSGFVYVNACTGYRPAPNVNLTEEEVEKLEEVLDNLDLEDVAFKDHYKTLQDAIDAAVGEGRAIATMKYKGRIDGTPIESASSHETGSSPQIAEVCESESGCDIGCRLPEGVGGIAEFPNASAPWSPESDVWAEDSGSAGWIRAALAVGLAGAAVAVAAGGWYARRRWLK